MDSMGEYIRQELEESMPSSPRCNIRATGAGFNYDGMYVYIPDDWVQGKNIVGQQDYNGLVPCKINPDSRTFRTVRPQDLILGHY